MLAARRGGREESVMEGRMHSLIECFIAEELKIKSRLSV